MKSNTGRSEDVLKTVSQGQKVESGNIQYAEKEIPKAKNALTKTVLQALKLEAEKHHLIQQMIIDSLKKEAVNLSPEELRNFSLHINKHLEAEEKALSFAKEAFDKSNLPIPRYLLSYLVADLKMQSELLSQFEDEMKTAAISTSVSSKAFSAPRAA